MFLDPIQGEIKQTKAIVDYTWLSVENHSKVLLIGQLLDYNNMKLLNQEVEQ